MLVSTGGIYRSQGGKKVGPLRPFREGEDGPARDIMGRLAWFVAEGIGAFDKFGQWLSGGLQDANHLVAEWEGPAAIDGHIERAAADHDLTIGTLIPLGTLLAEVRVAGTEVRVDKAWIEVPGLTLPLAGQQIETLGVFHAGRWRNYRAIITAAALAEVQA
ncbi:hypothetical protein EOA27_13235 [Mesorhizobium sp. M2A.F.Ca.ET.037.01.1.1]|uniref:hypothetical protein n=1 Tax=Mesorhizobium sp. M2A.F.Ca.ET.037.01.1.1 TaxID=2496748 RepID=UPI000FCAD80E|nr:hypothetical protein [Mesorhizobium sp. M2A.F.Ca.ET.037.01.1.1]RUX18818.1 hypothetical protein EOA27_13235 [Mesorhizobium sp. M2A.F.Ca.ET.037.01.1.1]